MQSPELLQLQDKELQPRVQATLCDTHPVRHPQVSTKENAPVTDKPYVVMIVGAMK